MVVEDMFVDIEELLFLVGIDSVREAVDCLCEIVSILEICVEMYAAIAVLNEDICILFGKETEYDR